MYLRIQDFDYDLPEDRIATEPAQVRDAAKLLTLDVSTGVRRHASFRDISSLIRPRSLVVLNDTRVIPARLLGRKPTGGRVEVLLVRKVEDKGRRHNNHSGETWEEMWEALVRGMGKTLTGDAVSFCDGPEGEAALTGEIVTRKERGAVIMRFRGRGPGGLLARAETMGQVPLPPYIEAARRRKAESGEVTAVDDRVRYQTVYAQAPGAVAAPTAGLHFTEERLGELAQRGHEVARVTLHVGPGTFRPVELEDPRSHKMDPERYAVPEETASAIARARAEGRPVVAVGTTVVRTLEAAAAADGNVRAGPGETDLFLLPGARFRVVTDLITNFHLPRSTLLMLVSAFADRGQVLEAYAEAIAHGYRFYSYGDAMLVTRGGAHRT